MKNFAQNQGNASEADLQYKSPLSYQEDRFKGGTEQSTASMAAISQSPWDLMPINVGTNPITLQTTASDAPLSHAPEHGWESYPTKGNMSDRSIKQSK